MKRNFLIKKLAVAIAAAYAPTALAAVVNNITTTIDLDAGTGVQTYASQLQMTDAYPLTGGANALNFKAELGFGISSGQTRYLRFDFGNATFDAVFQASDIEMTSVNNFSSAVAQAGGLGHSHVIFQVTANADYASSDTFDVKVPPLRVSNTSSPVTVTYSLHETAVSAVAGLAGNALIYSKTGTIANFATGLNFTLTPRTNIAAVTKGYKEFCKDTACTETKVTVPLGGITYDKTSVKDRDGTPLALSDIVTTANIIVTGNFGAAGSVFIDDSGAGNCADTTPVNGTLDSAKTFATFTVNSTSVPADSVLCYTVTGSAPIPAQTVTAELDVLTVPADVVTNDVPAATLGTIVRNGTMLKFPYLAAASGQSTFVQLTNSGTTDANYTTTCYKDNGSVAGLNGTVPAGQSKKVTVSTLCPAGTKSVAITADVPAGQLVGSAVRVHNTSGATAMDGATGNQ